MGFKNHELFIRANITLFTGPFLEVGAREGSWFRKRGMPLRAVSADLLSLLGSLRLFPWLTRHRYLIPPSTIEMIGQLPQSTREVQG